MEFFECVRVQESSDESMAKKQNSSYSSHSEQLTIKKHNTFSKHLLFFAFRKVATCLALMAHIPICPFWIIDTDILINL